MRRRYLIGLSMLAAFAAAPVWAQTTNQLFMTGTGTGNTPVIYSNGVDTNVNMGFIPKGTGGVGIGTTSPQSGAELTVSNTAVTGTTYGGYFSSATTGAGYGVYSTITGAANTGYAGYFTNTATTGSNYGLYVVASSASGRALFALNNASGAVALQGEADVGVANGVLGQSGSTSAGSVGVQGAAWGGGTNSTYGVSAYSNSTGPGYGVLGQETGAANTGYGGYFTNTGTGAVNYGVYATTASTTGWAGYFSGNIYATGTIQLGSDRRLKKNIQTLNPVTALDNIASLRPVAFKWKKSGKPDMGLIAQEIEPIYPELVARSADDKLSIEYVSLIAPLIASIQELKKRDDKVEAENAELRRDFDNYRATHP